MDTASQSEETKAEMDDLSSKIPPWARGDHLRSVEKEVLIPKIMRERSREKCHDLVQAFTQCAKKRTVSIVWACRKENKAMKDCLTSYYQDKEFFEVCKEEYLKKREEFQRKYAQSGEAASLRKKDSVIM